MENKGFKDTLLRGIALLGLILVLVLGAWGIIVLAFNAPNILSSAGSTIAGIFSSDRGNEVEEETVEVPVVSPETPSTPATPSTPSTPSPKPTYTYTPAPQPVVQLYGYADLAVRILSVIPQPAPTYASGGSRYSMQFEVSNVGTNVAGGGWTFDAQLPLNPTYTYRSGPQQTLRPGDKIVYTLGFDMPNFNYNYDYRFNDDYRYPHDYNYYGGNRVVIVTANPFGALFENNRFNNTASQTINFNHNYYPTYPTPTYPYYPQYPYPYAY